jgi:hypothetical protein
MVPCGPYIVCTDKVFTENGKEKGYVVFKLSWSQNLDIP